MDITPLTFEHNGKSRNCRRINFSDHAYFRQLIRMERLQSAKAAGGSPEVQAISNATPVSWDEYTNLMCSDEGKAILLQRCVCHFDQTFTKDEAEQMVIEQHPFLMELMKVENGGFFVLKPSSVSGSGSSEIAK